MRWGRGQTKMNWVEEEKRGEGRRVGECGEKRILLEGIEGMER